MPDPTDTPPTPDATAPGADPGVPGEIVDVSAIVVEIKRSYPEIWEIAALRVANRELATELLGARQAIERFAAATVVDEKILGGDDAGGGEHG